MQNLVCTPFTDGKNGLFPHPHFHTCNARNAVLVSSLTEKNYWADNSYYSDLEVTIYGQ